LVDCGDRFRADQLLEHDEIVAIRFNRVGRPPGLFQLAPIPRTSQVEAACRRQWRQATQDWSKGAGGTRSEERQLIGRCGRESLLPREERGIFRIWALPFGGGQTVDPAIRA
jgi:hypothetical protein